MDGHYDDEEDDDESGDSEEDEEQDRENSQNVGKRSQSSHVRVAGRADVGAIVNSLVQEGENQNLICSFPHFSVKYSTFMN